MCCRALPKSVSSNSVSHPYPSRPVHHEVTTLLSNPIKEYHGVQWRGGLRYEGLRQNDLTPNVGLVSYAQVVTVKHTGHIPAALGSACIYG